MRSQENGAFAYGFASAPVSDDYFSLADHIANSPQPQLHSALWPQRVEVADRLRRMGQVPEREAHRAAYHALRLMLW